MMIHEDVDDEETLDEEEALQSQEEIRDEVDNLQEVGQRAFEGELHIVHLPHNYTVILCEIDFSWIFSGLDLCS